MSNYQRENCRRKPAEILCIQTRNDTLSDKYIVLKWLNLNTVTHCTQYWLWEFAVICDIMIMLYFIYTDTFKQSHSTVHTIRLFLIRVKHYCQLIASQKKHDSLPLSSKMPTEHQHTQSGSPDTLALTHWLSVCSHNEN